MRNAAIMLLFLVLTLTACDKQEVGVSGFSVRFLGREAWQMMGTNGCLLVQDSFAAPASPVVNGMFTVRDSSGKYQLFTISDSVVRPVSVPFAQIGHFFEEVTIAQQEYNTPLLLVHRSGEILARLPESILMAHNFREGMALVYFAQGKYGYINTRGEVVIEPIYDYAYDFSDNRAVVGITHSQGGTSYRVIDRKGQVVFPVHLQNSRINGMFSGGRLMFRERAQNYCGYLDKNGKTVLSLPDSIQESGDFRYGAALILTEKGIGVIDAVGKVVIPAHFEQARIVAPNRVALQLNDKWALFDFKGQPLCDFMYDDLSDFNRAGVAFAKADSSYWLVNDKGEAITPYRFGDIQTDRTATREIPQVFTFHAPQAAPEPVSEVSPKADSASVAFPTTNSVVGQNNPFYAEMQKVISGQLPETDARNRQVILEYMERFRSSYTLKDIDFLEQLFSEDALIIVGKVVRKAPVQGARYLSSEQVVYNLKSKREYLDRLKAVFTANKRIDVRFRDFVIRKHPTVKGIYGVTVQQQYTSDLYADEGYLFLLWDFRLESAPQLHVRTWQPRMLDEHTPLPEQEIFSIRNFNME